MNPPLLKPGDIVLIPFPYTNYLDKKRRPALVISNTNFNKSSDVILAAISSNLTSGSNYDVNILNTDPDFVQTGLKKSSTVKPGRIFTFSQAQIDRRLGTFPRRLLTQVKKVIATIIIN